MMNNKRNNYKEARNTGEKQQNGKKRTCRGLSLYSLGFMVSS